MQQCNLSPCEVSTWNVSDWNTCNATCGGRSSSSCLSSMVQIVKLQNRPDARLPFDALSAVLVGGPGHA